jgi:hypothetical protein
VTSILSSISGYFSKSLILGTFLPVVVFMVLSMLFLVPLLPTDLRFLAPLENIDKQWKVIAASFITIVISGLVYNLNIPILRWYEGYPWKDSWIGTWMTRRHKKRFDAAQNRATAMRAARELMKKTDKEFSSQEQWIKEVFEDLKGLDAPLIEQGNIEHSWEKIWQTPPTSGRLSATQRQWQDLYNSLTSQHGRYLDQIKTNYPENRGLILPTRLGNVIRSFEYYPFREYRIDSIALWPRMIAIIPKEYAAVMDDAKTTFDFMINCSVLSFVLAFSMLLAGLAYPSRLVSSTPLSYWLIEIAVFFQMSYFFYRLSVNRVGNWGGLVKSAFDLFRWDLLERLGYHQKPTTREEERNIWIEISRQITFGDRFDKGMLNYAKDPPLSYPSVRTQSAKVTLEITKGVKTRSWTDIITVYLRVKNVDTNLAEKVIATDKLFDDFDYEWESAQVAGASVPVSGTNPYRFELGDLSATGEVVLKYNAIPRKKAP